MTPDLPLLGLPAFGALHHQARRDLQARRETVFAWRGPRPASRVTIDVARDPLGLWAASWSWHIGTDLGEQTGTVGQGMPWTFHRWPSRDTAIAAACAAILGALPAYTGAAGREAATIRREVLKIYAPVRMQEAA